MYNTIIHPLRKAFNLSIHEYCVLDTIFFLSNNRRYNWCIKSKQNIADSLDISRRTVNRIIPALIAKGLLEKSEQGFLRTTDEWNDVISNKDEYVIGLKNEENMFISAPQSDKKEQGVQKLHSVCQNDTGCAKMAQGVKKRHSDCVKMAHKNNIENNNNIIISKDIIETSSPNKYGGKEISNLNSPIKELSEKPKEKSCAKKEKVYGNEDINNLLTAIKMKVGISDFVDTQRWQRIYGKHCVALMKKIGPTEFSRRLDIILDDAFKHKNCNSLKYLYNQIKGFIEPKQQSNTIKL